MIFYLFYISHCSAIQSWFQVDTIILAPVTYHNTVPSLAWQERHNIRAICMCTAHIKTTSSAVTVHFSSEQLLLFTFALCTVRTAYSQKSLFFQIFWGRTGGGGVCPDGRYITRLLTRSEYGPAAMIERWYRNNTMIINTHDQAAEMQLIVHTFHYANTRLNQQWLNVSCLLCAVAGKPPGIIYIQISLSGPAFPPSKHGGIHPMLVLCWASDADGGPLLKQRWV